MNRHTKGLWFVDAQTASVWSDPGKDANDLQIAHCWSSPGFGMQRDFSVVLANARLIAAAPDLLAALKTIVRDWDGEPEDMCAAIEAIAKAEGSA